MKLLIITQTIDKKDSALGFFHKWVLSLSTQFEHVEVICLKKGEYNFPPNVSVSSLGKELGNRSRIQYILRFYRLIWNLKRKYDGVFIHMNQEYILLGGLIWAILGKKVFMWRNHYGGSFLTDIAAAFCNKVFCTSKFSYTAKYKKTVLMPVGVDVDSCKMDVSIDRIPRSVLFLGRLDESKRPHLLIEALGIIAKQGIKFNATFVGGPSKTDSGYPIRLEKQVEELGIRDKVKFVGAVPNTETFRYYRSHDVFVNCSKSGMFDKTIFKSVACGCLTIATSRDFGDLVGDEFIFADNDSKALAEKLKRFLTVSFQERAQFMETLASCIKNHSLEALVIKLKEEIDI